MKFRLSTVHSMRPAFEISIGAEMFFKGLTMGFIFWRKGKKLTITTNKIYAEYLADLINRDELIAAQDRLINLYKAKEAVTKNFDTAIIPFVIPPWPYGRF